MGLIELIIVVLVLLWLFGYFGRGRWYATGSGGATDAGLVGGSWLHILIVLAVILLLLRLLNIV